MAESQRAESDRGVFGRHRPRAGRACRDDASGLKAIIATLDRLGPALGGTRFYPYTSEGGRARRRSEPSRALAAYKSAITGLDLGRGKAVVIGDPLRDKSDSAAAGVRPLRAVARRALHHGL